MRKLLVFLWLVTGLAVAHEGGRHANLRDGQPDEVVEQRQLSVNGQAVEAELRRWPTQPVPGNTVGFLLTLRQKLAPPDPLLGDTLPVEAAVELLQPSPLPFHAEEETGHYGLDWKPPMVGRYRLTIQVKPAEGEPWTLEHTVMVGPSQRGRLALLASVLVGLGALGLALVPWARRSRRWLVALPVSGGAIFLLVTAGLATDPAPPTPPPAPALAPPTDQVRIEPKLQEALEIRVAPVERQSVTRQLEFPGTLVVPPGRTQSIVSPVTGRLVALDARAGQEIRRGETVAVVEELVGASERAALELQALSVQASRQDLAVRQREQALRRRELDRELQEAGHQVEQRSYQRQQAEKLYGLEVLARQDLISARFAEEEARARRLGLARERAELGRQLANPVQLPGGDVVLGTRRSVASPLTATVAELEAAPGQQVQAGQKLLELVDVSTLWVEALIPESDVTDARRARVAEVLPASGGTRRARRVLLAPRLDPETRTLRASYQLANPDRELLANMSATVRLQGVSRVVLAVPAAAVVELREGRGRVFVRVEPEVFEARSVLVTETVNGLCVIREGLEAGEEVVVQGASQLEAELQRRAPRKEP